MLPMLEITMPRSLLQKFCLTSSSVLYILLLAVFYSKSFPKGVPCQDFQIARRLNIVQLPI